MSIMIHGYNHALNIYRDSSGNEVYEVYYKGGSKIFYDREECDKFIEYIKTTKE